MSSGVAAQLAGRILRAHRGAAIATVAVVAATSAVGVHSVVRAAQPRIDAGVAQQAVWGRANVAMWSRADANLGPVLGDQDTSEALPPSGPNESTTSLADLADRAAAWQGSTSTWRVGTAVLATDDSEMDTPNGPRTGVNVTVVEADLGRATSRGMFRLVDGRVPRNDDEAVRLVPALGEQAELSTDLSPSHRELVRSTDAVDLLAPPISLSVVGTAVVPFADILANSVRSQAAAFLVLPGALPDALDTDEAAVVFGTVTDPDGVDADYRREDQPTMPSAFVAAGSTWTRATVVRASLSLFWAVGLASVATGSLLRRRRRDLAQLRLAGAQPDDQRELAHRLTWRLVVPGAALGIVVGGLAAWATRPAVEPLLAAGWSWWAFATPVLVVAVWLWADSSLVTPGPILRLTRSETRSLLSGRAGPVQRTGQFGRFGGPLAVLVVATGALLLIIPLDLRSSVVNTGARALLVIVGATSTVAWLAGRAATRTLAGRSGRTAALWATARLHTAGASFPPRLVATMVVAVIGVGPSLVDITPRELPEEITASPSFEAPLERFATPTGLMSVNADGVVTPAAPTGLLDAAWEVGFRVVGVNLNAELCADNLPELARSVAALNSNCIGAPVYVLRDDAIETLPEPTRTQVGNGLGGLVSTIPVSVLPRGLEWRVGERTLPLAPVGEDLAALERVRQSLLSAEPLAALRPTVAIIVATAVIEQLTDGRVPVSSFHADASFAEYRPPNRSGDALDRRLDAMARELTDRTGVQVGGPDGSNPAPIPPEGLSRDPSWRWDLTLASLLVGLTVAFGLLIARWERPDDSVIVARYGATRLQIAAAATARATSLVVWPAASLACGLAAAQLASRVRGSLMGSFLVDIDWWAAAQFSAAAAVIAGATVFVAVWRTCAPHRHRPGAHVEGHVTTEQM